MFLKIRKCKSINLLVISFNDLILDQIKHRINKLKIKNI